MTFSPLLFPRPIHSLSPSAPRPGKISSSSGLVLISYRRKAEYPGFVETPGRRSTRTRKSLAPTGESSTDASPATSQILEKKSTSTGAADGAAATPAPKRGRPSKKKVSAESAAFEVDGYEFGGPVGASAIIFFSPVLMYVMWIGATYYNGKIPYPRRNETWGEFAQLLVALVYDGAFPNLKAWGIYWGFLVFQGACYLYLPGIYVKGKALEWEGGKRLDYYCSGLWSFHLTTVLALGLHAARIWRLDTVIDEFGPIMSVSIITGFVVSVVAYVSAIYRGKTARMTGSHVYDFFMGAEINPRLFGWLDFKMFFEVRLPWYILYLVSLATCARQYERYGYVSGEALFLLMAHFLYANACSKAEEAIVTTWDMYYEKWGWMLIFWNLAGVPFTYCHGAIYLANNHPSTYRWNRGFLALLYVSYLFVYWVWDTCNSQKNRFRQMERGTLVERKTFPVLPWLTIQNPQTIKTKTGDSILVDGWYKYARKIHYTCDVYFAFTWGLITGFASPFPWFYVVFFVPMIFHRFLRDQAKCRKRYGEAWAEYERRVPYTFIPYVY